MQSTKQSSKKVKSSLRLSHWLSWRYMFIVCHYQCMSALLHRNKIVTKRPNVFYINFTVSLLHWIGVVIFLKHSQHRHIPHHPPWRRLYEDKCQQENHCVILKDLVCVALLPGASALCFYSLLLLLAAGRKGRKVGWYCQRRIQQDLGARWQKQLYLGDTKGNRAGKCERSRHKQCRLTGWLLMSWSYLVGNLDKGQQLHANMSRCIKAGSRNANKAILQLPAKHSRKLGVIKVGGERWIMCDFRILHTYCRGKT